MAKKKHYYETREFRTVRAMLDYWAEKTPDNDIYQFRKGRGDEIEHVPSVSSMSLPRTWAVLCTRWVWVRRMLPA